MKRLAFYIVAIISGVFLSIEGTIYSELGKHIGTLESSLYNFVAGSIILFFFLLFFGKGSFSYTFKAPKWELTGGILGVIYLTVLVIGIPYAGVGLAMGSVVVGQMIISAVIEHFGLLGSEVKSVRKEKVLAIFLMLIALILIY